MVTPNSVPKFKNALNYSSIFLSQKNLSWIYPRALTLIFEVMA